MATHRYPRPSRSSSAFNRWHSPDRVTVKLSLQPHTADLLRRGASMLEALKLAKGSSEPATYDRLLFHALRAYVHYLHHKALPRAGLDPAPIRERHRIANRARAAAAAEGLAGGKATARAREIMAGMLATGAGEELDAPARQTPDLDARPRVDR